MAQDLFTQNGLLAPSALTGLSGTLKFLVVFGYARSGKSLLANHLVKALRVAAGMLPGEDVFMVADGSAHCTLGAQYAVVGATVVVDLQGDEEDAVRSAATLRMYVAVAALGSVCLVVDRVANDAFVRRLARVAYVAAVNVSTMPPTGLVFSRVDAADGDVTPAILQALLAPRVGTTCGNSERRLIRSAFSLAPAATPTAFTLHDCPAADREPGAASAWAASFRLLLAWATAGLAAASPLTVAEALARLRGPPPAASGGGDGGGGGGGGGGGYVVPDAPGTGAALVEAWWVRKAALECAHALAERADLERGESGDDVISAACAAHAEAARLRVVAEMEAEAGYDATAPHWDAAGKAVGDETKRRAEALAAEIIAAANTNRAFVSTETERGSRRLESRTIGDGRHTAGFAAGTLVTDVWVQQVRQLQKRRNGAVVCSPWVDTRETSQYPDTYAEVGQSFACGVWPEGKKLKHERGLLYPNTHFHVQRDGNLVIYNTSGAVRWASGTDLRGTPPYRLVVGPGTAVLQDGTDAAIFDLGAMLNAGDVALQMTLRGAGVFGMVLPIPALPPPKGLMLDGPGLCWKRTD